MESLCAGQVGQENAAGEQEGQRHVLGVSQVANIFALFYGLVRG
jgi:hypothetical protein